MDKDEEGPPSMVSSSGSDVGEMKDVDDEDDESDEDEVPPMPWDEMLPKERWPGPQGQEDEGENQESKQASTRLGAKRSKRAMKRMGQRQNRKQRGQGICKVGCG